MDTTNKLSSYVTDNVNQQRDVTRQEPQFSAFINLFGINLVHRYPGMLDLDTIEVPTIESIARFSLVCSRVATDLWAEEVQGAQQRPQRRQARAA